MPPPPTNPKRPESVLVVVYTRTGKVLLLRRTGMHELSWGTQTPRCRDKQNSRDGGGRIAPQAVIENAESDPRCDLSDFWQSVTGSMKWDESSPRDAAKRELYEETGLIATHALRDLGLAYRYPILPAWRQRYAPEVTENLEHVFALELPQESDLTINSIEHCEYGWFSCDEALNKVASWTNREAILAIEHFRR